MRSRFIFVGNWLAVAVGVTTPRNWDPSAAAAVNLRKSRRGRERRRRVSLAWKVGESSGGVVGPGHLGWAPTAARPRVTAGGSGKQGGGPGLSSVMALDRPTGRGRGRARPGQVGSFAAMSGRTASSRRGLERLAVQPRELPSSANDSSSESARDFSDF